MKIEYRYGYLDSLVRSFDSVPLSAKSVLSDIFLIRSSQNLCKSNQNMYTDPKKIRPVFK